MDSRWELIMRGHHPMLVVACLLLISNPVAAQDPLRVVPGWGVDTTGAVAWSESSRFEHVREIYRRWGEYLRSNPRQQAPTPLWSA